MEQLNLNFFKGKTVFITGHTGFKGSWLSEILVSAGATLVGYALAPPDNPSLFNILKIERHMQSITDDIRDFSHLKQAVLDARPEIVIHMAAQPIVRESYIDPIGTYETNVMGTVNLLEACRGVDSIKSIVNVTTDKVYENKEWIWGYREDENLCGQDPYSNSKSCSELVTYSYINSFFNTGDAPAVSTARSGNVIGGGDFAKDRIIPDCIRAANIGEKIVIRNPYSTRPYQHVLECLSGYLLLAKLQYEDKQIASNFNFGPNEDSCVTTESLVKLFCEKWGDGMNYVVRSDGGPHEANFLKLDITKAAAELEWTPKWNISTAVANVVEWHKSPDSDKITITEKQIREHFR